MDPGTSDTRDFVSSRRRDPTARDDDLVAATVQLRSIERVAKWRDARASRRQALCGSGDEQADQVGIQDADARGRGSPESFSDAEERALHAHRQRLAASPLARPHSASHVRPPLARSNEHQDATARVRPQSAKASRRASGISSPVGKPLDLAWMPTAVKQSKWTEMLQHGPRFQEQSLQRLEAETYALLQRVLRGPAKKQRSAGHSSEDRERGHEPSATKKKTRSSNTEKTGKATSVRPAVGSGLQVVRNSKKAGTQTSSSKTPKSSTRKDHVRGSAVETQASTARGAPSIDRRAVIEKTVARTKSAPQPKKKKKKREMPTDISDKEQKKRLAEAEASAKVMREMGWLDDLAVSDSSEPDVPKDKNASTKKKKNKKKAKAILPVCDDGNVIARASSSPRPVDQDLDEHSPRDGIPSAISSLLVTSRQVYLEDRLVDSHEAFRLSVSGAQPANWEHDSSLQVLESSNTMPGIPQGVQNHNQALPHTSQANEPCVISGEDDELVSLVSELDLAQVSNPSSGDTAHCLLGTVTNISVPEVVTVGVQSFDCCQQAELSDPEQPHINFDTLSQHGTVSSDVHVVHSGRSPILETPPSAHELEENISCERDCALNRNSIDYPLSPDLATQDCPVPIRHHADIEDLSMASVFQPGAALSADQLNECFEHELQSCGSESEANHFGVNGSEEAHVPDPPQVCASSVHGPTPPVNEDPLEPIIADEYAEECFEEEAVLEGIPAESKNDVYQTDLRGDSVSLIPCSDDNTGDEHFDAELKTSASIFTELYSHASNQNAHGIPRESNDEVPGVDHSDLSRECCHQRDYDSHGVAAERAAQSIQRQYRAFCNRRVIFEQVTFLSRKSRRAKRKKTRDIGGDTAANHAAVVMCDTTRDSSAGQEVGVPSVTFLAESADNRNADEHIAVDVHVADASDDLNVAICPLVENAKLGDDRNLHLVSEHEANDGVSLETDKTAVDQIIEPDEGVDANRSSNSEGNTVLYLDAGDQVVDENQQATDSAPIHYAFDTVENGHNRFTTTDPTSGDMLETQVSGETVEDEVTAYQQPSAVPSALESTTLAEPQPAERDVETGCLGDREAEVEFLEADQDQTFDGDYAATFDGDYAAPVSPQTEATSDADGDSYSQTDIHSSRGAAEVQPPHIAHSPAIIDVGATEVLLDDPSLPSFPSGQRESEMDEPSSTTPSMSVTFEEPGRSEFASMDRCETEPDLEYVLEVTMSADGPYTEDEPSGDLTVAEGSATPITSIELTSTDANAHVSGLPRRDPARAQQSITVNSNAREVLVAPSTEEAMTAEAQLSSAAGLIQRAWKEYVTHPTIPRRAEGQDAAATELEGSGHSGINPGSSTVEHIATNFGQDISSDPQKDADPSFSPMEDERGGPGPSAAVADDTTLCHVASLLRCEDSLEPEPAIRETDTKQVSETDDEGVAYEISYVCDKYVRGGDEFDPGIDESPIISGVEVASTVESDVALPSISLRREAAQRILRQYRRHVFRRNLLDQLAFFVRHHRRESRKKTRRLSGGLVHRVSADLPGDDAKPTDLPQGPLGAQRVEAVAVEAVAVEAVAVEAVAVEAVAVEAVAVEAVAVEAVAVEAGAVEAGEPILLSAAHTPDGIGSLDTLSTSTANQVAASGDDIAVPGGTLITDAVADPGVEGEDTVGSSLPCATSSPATSLSTWERYMDSGANKSFYYNPQKQLTQWDRPSDSDVVDRTLASTVSTQAGDGGASESVVDDTNASVDLHDRWERYKDSQTNKTFYFHRASQVSQWERPSDACVVDSTPPATCSSDERWRLARPSATVLESFGGWDRCLCADSAEVFYCHADRDAFVDGSAEPREFAAAKAQLLDAASDTSDARWTLRRNRSLRGDRRGEWQAFVDTATHQPFYYNTVTGESSWDKPPAFQDTAASFEWVMYVDAATAQPYYVNLATGATSWERPADFDAAVSAQDLSRLRGIGEQHEALAATEDQDEYVISIQDDQDAAEWLAL